MQTLDPRADGARVGRGRIDGKFGDGGVTALGGLDGQRLGAPGALIENRLDRSLPEAWLVRGRRFAAGHEIVEQGGTDALVYFVKSGWACQFRMASADRRQIISLLLPGDHCGLRMGGGVRGASGLSAITACEIVGVPRSEVLRGLDEDPSLATAMWAANARQQVIQEERLATLGRRPALAGVAHLLCELVFRSARLGPTGQECELPLNQADLGDVVGLSAVHVNRVLQSLRAMKLVEVRRGRFIVLNAEGLRSLAEFDPEYLQLD